MKTCTKCGDYKQYDEFVKDKSKKDGYSSQCKNCKHKRYILLKSNSLFQLKKEITSSIILENKMLIKDGKQICSHCKKIFKIENLRARKCINCHNLLCEKWRENNKEKIREIGKKYRESNIEKIREKAKKRIIDNRDEYLKKGLEYREKNKDKISLSKKQYAFKNNEKIKEYQKEYRLKKKLEKENKATK